jgi:hypothetical protein
MCLGDHAHDLAHLRPERPAGAVRPHVDRLLVEQRHGQLRELHLVPMRDVRRRGDRREPDDAPAHGEAEVHRVRVQAADLRVQHDAAEDVDAGGRDPVTAQGGDVGRRVVVVRLADDRAHAGIRRALRRLGGVHPPGERRRGRMHVQVDRAVEEPLDDVAAHAAAPSAANDWRPYPMIRWA